MKNLAEIESKMVDSESDLNKVLSDLRESIKNEFSKSIANQSVYWQRYQMLTSMNDVNRDFHFPSHCIDSNDNSRCIEEHRHRIRRNDVTPNAPAVLYLPLGGSTSQGCPSTAESSVVGISQMVFLWTIMSVFSAVGNVVANINNNQNNNNNNDNNVNLNIVSTHNTQISANTNNANTISIMLPPPLPIFAGGRKLEAELRLKRFIESEEKRRKKRDVKKCFENESDQKSFSGRAAIVAIDILRFLFEKRKRVVQHHEARDCLGKRLCQLQKLTSKLNQGKQGTYLETALLKISRFALLFVQLEDRSQAFIQFLENMNNFEVEKNDKEIDVKNETTNDVTNDFTNDGTKDGTTEVTNDVNNDLTNDSTTDGINDTKNDVTNDFTNDVKKDYGTNDIDCDEIFWRCSAEDDI